MKVAGILLLVVLSVLSVGAQPQPPVGGTLSWAWPEAGKNLPPIKEDDGARSVPGSTKTYTQKEIANPRAATDWFPDQRPPAPEIILQGHDDVWACGSCHLMSGLGHPEHADLTGFTSDYLNRQMFDFKSGARKDGSGRMNTFAKGMSDEEIRQSSEWFALLKPRVFTKVSEVATVPKTYLGTTRMRFVHPDGGTEPIGNRIVTVPQDESRARNRDPNSGYTTYVPIGSLKKGEALVKTGGSGKTIPCAVCHGDSLNGLADIPRLAGQHALYIVRQLRDFQTGARNGKDAALMKASVAKLTDEDIVAIAAYLAAQAP